jgi:hypothetical protein
MFKIAVWARAIDPPVGCRLNLIAGYIWVTRQIEQLASAEEMWSDTTQTALRKPSLSAVLNPGLS